jgi:hypothetical protein
VLGKDENKWKRSYLDQQRSANCNRDGRTYMRCSPLMTNPLAVDDRDKDLKILFGIFSPNILGPLVSVDLDDDLLRSMDLEPGRRTPLDDGQSSEHPQETMIPIPEFHHPTNTPATS